MSKIGTMVNFMQIQLVVAGNGIVVEFATSSEKAQEVAAKTLGEDGFAAVGSSAGTSSPQNKWKGFRCGIGNVDEVNVLPDGSFEYVRRLNGDQDHQGRHVRISVGDYKVLHVKLYRYL